MLMRVAVVLHLHYHDLWAEFSERISHVCTALNGSVDVSISLNTPDPIAADLIHKDFPNAKVLVLPNTGLDIGPFLLWLWQSRLHHGADHYDFVLKMHSKKGINSTGLQRGTEWRCNSCDALAGNLDQVFKCLDLLQRDRVGMVGNIRDIRYRAAPNRPLTRAMLTHFNITPAGGRFVAGTMFWFKPRILYQYLSQASLVDLYRRMESGYSRDGTLAHVLERLFGHMIEDAGFTVAGVTANKPLALLG